MKLKKSIYAFLIAAILIGVGSGCRKSQFNINKDPNNPTDSTVTYDVVLPSAMHASGTIVANQWGTIENWMGYWARSGTYAPNVIEETYQITTGFGNGIWNACYDNNYDYQIVIAKASQVGASFYEGIARIMRSLNMQTLVDVYGNVPFSQSGKGSANPTPAYDNGIDIYKALFRQIDTGIALIKGANVTSTNVNKNIWTNDILFGNPVSGVIGNVPAMKGLWARFGNTLKLRMLIHCYAVPGFPIAAEMAIINTEGSGFLGVGENAQINPGYSTTKPNPFYGSYYKDGTGAQTANNVYYRANQWGIDYYNYNGDPRRSQGRTYETGSGGLIGVPYGLPPVTANASPVLAGIGPGVYKSASAAQCIMTSAESFFLQAEARQRGIISSGATAASLLTTAVNESFNYLGATGAANYLAINAGYADCDITAAPLHANFPAGGLFTILSQKWFAMNGIDPLETWTDYRRVPYSEVAVNVTNVPLVPAPTDHFVYGAGVDYPAGPPISVAPQNTSTKIPVRYLYPQTEYNYNAGNVGAQGTVNPFTSRIFWDIN